MAGTVGVEPAGAAVARRGARQRAEADRGGPAGVERRQPGDLLRGAQVPPVWLTTNACSWPERSA